MTRIETDFKHAPCIPRQPNQKVTLWGPSSVRGSTCIYIDIVLKDQTALNFGTGCTDDAVQLGEEWQCTLENPIRDAGNEGVVQWKIGF